jgi:hypothetical protein
MINTQYINLNMVPSGYPPVLYLSQHDIGRPCGFVVSASGSTVDLDTYTVTLEATRTDGTAITVPVITSGNIAAFATTAVMTNKADKYPANMVIVDSGGNRIASIPITILVVKAAMDENAESIEEDRSLYQQFTGTVQALIADIREDINKLTHAMSRINIAYKAGTLTSANFKSAFFDALAESNLIYIPAGTWNFDVIGKIELALPVDIIADENAIFVQTTSTDYLFTFSDTVRWKGGTFRIGPNRGSTDMMASQSGGLQCGAFRFDGCTNSTVEGMRVDWCKLPGVINAYNTYGFTVRNCTMTDCIESCVRFFEHCVNTVVENCHFERIKIPTNRSDIYYCYAVSTGLVSLSDTDIVPPDNLIYRNNTVIESDDSGLDTHGATNVMIENNVITDCNTAITAYNDSRRVERPAGWEMSNVIIRNNVCVSSYVYAGSNAHPYIIIAGPNRGIRDTHDYLIENNIFVTPNSTSADGNTILSLGRLKRVTVRNNTFDGTGVVRYAILAQKCEQIEIAGNIFKNLTYSGIFAYIGASVVTHDNAVINTPSILVQTSESYAYVKASDEYRNRTDRMLAIMDGNVSNGFLSVSRKVGITKNPYETFTTDSFECTLTDGVLTSTSVLPFFADLRLLVGGNAYLVTETLTDYSVSVRAISAETANGTYTVTADTAALAPHIASPTTFSGTDLNDLPRGVAYITGQVTNEPVPWATWQTSYTVYCVPKRTADVAVNVQVAFHADNVYIRSQSNSTTWNSWKKLATG